MFFCKTLIHTNCFIVFLFAAATLLNTNIIKYHSGLVVSEAAVCGEAEELEMQTERYIQDLQQALTETENSTAYSFNLTPSPPDRSSTVTLAYDKVQKDICVSRTAVISLVVSQCGTQITAGADV